MKNGFIAGLVVILASVVAIGAARAQTQETSTGPTSTVLDPPKTDTESALVRAAREAKAKRKLPHKVLTNKDVKNSKGRLAINTPSPLPPTATAKPVTDTRSPLEKQDVQYKARKDAEARVATGEKKVSELEKDLAAVEQAYYEEKDLNRRDTVIQKRFEQVKRQLEEARKDLADARDAVGAAKP